MGINKPILSILLFIVLISGCSSMPLQTPTAKVDTTNSSIPIEIASYHWAGKETYGGAWEITENKQATIVPANSKIKISYDYPPESVSINEVLDKNYRSINISTESNEIVVPDKKGVHIYSIVSKWPKGTVNYAIKIEVN